MKFHHFGIEVENLEKSSLFYQEALGFQEERRMTVDKERIIFLVKNDFRLELILSGLPEGSPRGVHICYEVDRLGEIIMSRGAPIEGPYVLENGWETVFYEGPDHEVIEFLQITKEVQSTPS